MPARIGSNITLPDLSSATSLLASTSNFCLSYILPDRSGPPVARIPPEVLQEIFLFTLLSPNNPSASGAIFPPKTYTPVISESRFATPFLLSHVNRQWRAVINNTPALWRSITLVAPHRNLFHRTELWLERSRNYSLDIAIRQYYVTEDISDATDKLLAMFAVHIARWRSVKFLFHLGIPVAAANALINLQRLPRPRLQDAAILAGHADDDDDGACAEAMMSERKYNEVQHIHRYHQLVPKRPSRRRIPAPTHSHSRWGELQRIQLQVLT